MKAVAPNLVSNTAKTSSTDKKETTRILVVGYGNPGRQDDGLGAACIEEIEYLEQGMVESNGPESRHKNAQIITKQTVYQLSVEQALDASEHDYVVFIDASINGLEPFAFKKLSRSNNACFGSHSLNPQGVLALCDSLYEKHPESYLLAIRGYEFDLFDEALTDKARENMKHAARFIRDWLRKLPEHHDRSREKYA